MTRGGLTLITVVVLAAAGGCKVTNQNYRPISDGGDRIEVINPDAPEAGGDTGGAGGAGGARDAAAAADASDAAIEVAPDVPPGCGNDDGCIGDPGGPACETQNRVCVRCTGPQHCGGDGGTNRQCYVAQHACVECLSNDDCSGTRPICDTTAHTCGACTTDAQCVARLGSPDPGVCMDDGHCADSGEVIYARAGGTCPGAGTATAPYCDPQMAIGAITAERRIIVMRGLLANWSLTGSGASRVTVVGQAGATIMPGGANDAVTISGANVLVRDLAIKGGSGVGMNIGTATTMSLQRCLISGNPRGGIVFDGAGFEIENTVVAHNGGATFAGINLVAANAQPRVFRNNTVIANGLGGVACGGAYLLTGSILAGNGGIQAPGCQFSDACALSCSSSANPNIDETGDRYQLTATSPAACKDVLDTAPATDRKGTTRPQGPRSDCGADELVPP